MTAVDGDNVVVEGRADVDRRKDCAEVNERLGKGGMENDEDEDDDANKDEENSPESDWW
jgi:hypothetical protein